MSTLNTNQTTYNIYKYTAFLSIAVIFLIGVAFLQPFSFTENTNATTERTTNGDYYIETTTTDLNLTINTTPAGTQETASHDVIVKTDDPAGYTLTVSVNNDTSNALNLNGSTSATEKFNATSGTYASPKALDENSWGFADTLTKKNNDQWAAVPLLSNAQQIKQTSSASTSGDTTTIHYALNAKYDGQHSNGNYSNTITYSVVGNTVPTPTALEDNMYMQDVTRGMCENTELYSNSNTTYTLKDKRDENSYTIRKLADGHCWMVTNLKLGKTTEMTLYNTDTDITDTSWNLPASSTITGDYNNAQMHIGTTSDSNWTSAYGNYYNWPAATAGKGTQSTSSGNIDVSICPKGWKLPKGEANTVDCSWAKLYNSGYTAATFRTATNTGTGYWSGYYYNGSLNSAGSGGYWWSRTAGSGLGAYVLNTGSSGVNPQGGNNKRSSLSVRCVLSAS